MSQTVFEPDWRHCYSISALKENEWNQLAGPNPFVQHAFLKALESSGCVGPADTGWEPAHLIGFHGKQLVAAMPLYRKWHSYGEYVFDHAWAQAYASTGFNYFPKLVCAIPYSPVSGPRLLAQTEDLLKALPRQLMQAARNLDVSSVHALFIAKDERDTWTQAGFHERAQIQFGWNNPGYESFSEFLDTLRHDKRKKIKQERKRTAGQDL
ncbi:MAG: N-acetyltransferase, partial [Pseudomonadota bacterium]|nr:N-acetyltransferase [Pseudomonadota bacterium]